MPGQIDQLATDLHGRKIDETPDRLRRRGLEGTPEPHQRILKRRRRSAPNGCTRGKPLSIFRARRVRRSQAHSSSAERAESSPWRSWSRHA